MIRSTKRVLLVDDDREAMRLYIKALRRQEFFVEHLWTTAEANAAIDCRGSEFSVVAIDMMMPPGEFLSLDETDRGMSTGISLYRRWIPKLPDWAKMLFLTNTYNPATMEKVQEIAPEAEVLNKQDYTPIKFAQYVRDIVRSSEDHQ